MDLTSRTHDLIRQHFANQACNVAVDATCGNGHDTEFLLRLGFTKVLAFDIQESALARTGDRLGDAKLDGASLINTGHQNMANYLDAPIDCAMFNFGYLPNADKSLTTQAETSVGAIQIAVEHLSDGGFITLLCYPGHPTGAVETAAIRDCLTSLKNTWQVDTHLAKSPKPSAPILYTLRRVHT